MKQLESDKTEKLIKEGMSELDEVKCADPKSDEAYLAKLRLLSSLAEADAARETEKANHRKKLQLRAYAAAMVIFLLVSFSAIPGLYGSDYILLDGENHYNESGVSETKDKGMLDSFILENFSKFFKQPEKEDSINKSELIDGYKYVISNNLNPDMIKAIEGSKSYEYIGVLDDNVNWSSSLSFPSITESINNDILAAKQYGLTAGVAFGISLEGRLVVKVKSPKGEPVNTAVVMGYNNDGGLVYTAITDNEGKAYLFSNMMGSGSENTIVKVSVSYNGIFANTVVDSSFVELTVNAEPKYEEKVLDLMFVISTKKSMGDVFDKLYGEIDGILQQVKEENPDLKIRLSFNFYRDRGELYLVRSFPFYEDTDTAVAIFGSQSCTGGGDYEQGVEFALSDAVYSHEWTDGAYAKLMFVFCDSPPRQDTAIVDNIKKTTEMAIVKGIRIIPVTQSNPDTVTQFLARALAVTTGGTYAFVTNTIASDEAEIGSILGEYSYYRFADGIFEIINRYLK